MALLDTDEGKRRLLTVEVPVIERYNAGRDPDFQIRMKKVGLGLVLQCKLKPCHNIYEMEIRLHPAYPAVPPEIKVTTPIRHCPHLLSGQTLCLWRQGSTRHTSRWDPGQHTSIFAVQAAWRWLACYEVWLSSGEWPLPDAR